VQFGGLQTDFFLKFRTTNTEWYLRASRLLIAAEADRRLRNQPDVQFSPDLAPRSERLSSTGQRTLAMSITLRRLP